MVLHGALRAAEGALDTVATLLEFLAAAIIVAGVATGLFRFVAGFVREGLGERARVTLIKDIIFGLDVLVAADIVRTATNPSMDELTRLAIVVVIRVLLTFVLTRELKEAEGGGGAHGG